jgi:diguanylate cyclase (GGDEF)-like protein
MNPSTRVFFEDAFRHLLTRETSRAMRYQDFFSVCLLKPDILDDRGGQADALIQAISAKVGQFLRATDLVGRLAHSVAIILLHTVGQDAARVTERLRANIEQVAFREAPEKSSQRLTVSVGEASFPRDGHTDTLLLMRAGANLHEAGLRGGNQVVYGVSDEK